MDNEENNALVPAPQPQLERLWINQNEARVNVTYAGSNGDLPDPVLFDSTDADVKTWIAEAIRAGSIPGIAADPNVNLRDFVLDRFEPTEQRPYRLLQIRPKTPFGYCSNTPFGVP